MKQPPSRVVFAGGGSGGHLVPGVEVASEVLRLADDARFLFLRGRRKVEGLVLERAPGETVHLRGLDAPTGRFGRLRFALKFPAVFARSVVMLKRFGADTVVGLGGYGAVPAVLAGRALGLRVLLLEQNVRPGLANRLLGPFAHRVCCAFGATAERFRNGRATGTPVRPHARLNRDEALKRFGLSTSGACLTLLVVGGSQGARGLNRLVTEHLGALTRFGEGVQVLHIAGEADRDAVAEAYRQHGIVAHVAAFVPDMDVAYRAVDLVLGRAGGTTVAELAIAGLPAALVPYPHHRDRHQYENARVFVDAGAGFMLDEGEADAAQFGRTVGALLGDRDLRARMSRAAAGLARPTAAATIARFIVESGEREPAGIEATQHGHDALARRCTNGSADAAAAVASADSRAVSEDRAIGHRPVARDQERFQHHEN